MTTAQKKTDGLPQAPQDAALDETSLAAIRELLAKDRDATPEPIQEEAAPVSVKNTARPPSKREMLESQSIAPPERRAQPARVSTEKPASAKKKPKSARRISGGRIDRARAAITGYRPTARHIVMAALALLILFRPWLVLGTVILSLCVLTAVFLILGYDGFWRRAMALGRWYARRHPSRAVELHRKLDSFAMTWDAILDRFPEGTVDGLYLPDFGDLATADARHDAAMDRRFSDLREREA